MHKQTIKKYKQEFEHWLNGGDVLIMETFGGWSKKTSENWNFRGPYVINDEYVEFRKALAVGSTIQIMVTSEKENYWRDLTNPQFNEPKEKYRIKPNCTEEIKIGDWAILYFPSLENKNENDCCVKVKGIKDNDFYSDYQCRQRISEDENNSGDFYISKKWHPKEGDWVVPDSGLNNDSFIVVKYDKIKLIPERCQPYMGTLPDSLREENK